MPWLSTDDGRHFNTDWLSEDERKKYSQIEENKKQASEQVKMEPPRDPFNGKLGTRKMSVKEVGSKIDELKAGNTINPHYSDAKQPKGNNYHNNCALCTAATMMQMRGYEMEAGVQVNNGTFREADSLFKVDYTNLDNVIYPSSESEFGYRQKLEKKLYRDFEDANPEASRGELRDMVDTELKKHVMPRGASKCASAITDKMQSWGDGAYGELTVTWLHTTSCHSLFIYNDKGTVKIFDSQIGKIYTDLEAFLKRTRANNTQLIRFDNAPFKEASAESLYGVAVNMFKFKNKYL